MLFVYSARLLAATANTARVKAEVKTRGIDFILSYTHAVVTQHTPNSSVTSTGGVRSRKPCTSSARYLSCRALLH